MAVDRDEQRELARAERVEDLPVVATRPHRLAVGDEAQVGDVVARLDEVPQRQCGRGRATSPASSSDATTRSATRSRNE